MEKRLCIDSYVYREKILNFSILKFVNFVDFYNAFEFLSLKILNNKQRRKVLI